MPPSSLIPAQKRTSLMYLMYLKEKKGATIKGCGCTNGRNQWETTATGEASPPIIRTESVLLTCTIDAEEE